MLSLLVMLLFIEITLVAPIPQQRYDAEWESAQEALESFGILRATLAGPMPVGGMISVPMPVGTRPVSSMASASPGTISFETAAIGPSYSFTFVPTFHTSSVSKLDQDIILLMDSSGSMQWNDPNDLRISSGKEYINTLVNPDRIAIVDFDSDAHFTRENVGGLIHHLDHPGHDDVGGYSEAASDLDTIDSNGGTNFGTAIQIANNEFVGYGIREHEWVMILLTDGQNNANWQNNLARSEASRAKALGVTIYTIGLGDEPDEALLTEIAETTGGTYYNAPTPESIRWIYFEISRRYSSAFLCNQIVAADESYGTLSLSLNSREYPSQTLRLEAGGISLRQLGGSSIREGIPFEFRPTRTNAGELALTAFTFTGTPTSVAGVDYEIVTARLLAQDIIEQPLTAVLLDDEAGRIGNISKELQDWTNAGAATPAGNAAVQAPLGAAKAATLTAHANFTAGEVTGAKFDVDRAQTHLADAITRTAQQVAALQIQSWLGAQLTDQMLVEGCRLDQWRNWFDGVTIKIASPNAAEWAQWANETMTAAGARVTVGVANGVAIISVHAVDNLILDRRTVRVSIGTG